MWRREARSSRGSDAWLASTRGVGRCTVARNADASRKRSRRSSLASNRWGRSGSRFSRRWAACWPSRSCRGGRFRRGRTRRWTATRSRVGRHGPGVGSDGRRAHRGRALPCAGPSARARRCGSSHGRAAARRRRRRRPSGRRRGGERPHRPAWIGGCRRPTCARAGEDVRVGDRVLEPGTVLSAAEIGLLATLGYGQVRVYRRPRVAILSTGNELADLGAEPRARADPQHEHVLAHCTGAGGGR